MTAGCSAIDKSFVPFPQNLREHIESGGGKNVRARKIEQLGNTISWERQNYCNNHFAVAVDTCTVSVQEWA